MTNHLHTSDATLVTLTLAGDQRAYETLVVRYQKSVIAAARSVTGNLYLAEDAAQDAFVSAWMKLDSLREPDKYGTWVCRIAVNCAKNLARRYRDYLCLDEPEGIAATADIPAPLSPEEEYADLHASLEGLPEKVRTVIRMHYFDGLSLEEIADRLRLPIGTVKWRLHDGRAKMRKELCGMNDNRNEQDTLLERVMKQVALLKEWKIKNNKEGFADMYHEVLSDVEALPESTDKYHAKADVLMQGWWWLPGEKNDQLLADIRDAAEKGQNAAVLGFVIRQEDDKLYGMNKIRFMRDKQIPLLEAKGLTAALGEEWFWLGYEYRQQNMPAERDDAFRKVMELLPATDAYYANAKAALTAEETVAGLCHDGGVDECDMAANAFGETLRRFGDRLCTWEESGYWFGNSNIDGGLIRANFPTIGGGCDHILYDESLRPGSTVVSSDGVTTLTLEDDNATAKTAMGDFNGCQVWTNTQRDTYQIRTYYKRGIGIVRLEYTIPGEGTAVRSLKSFHIEGGTGLLPLCAGNTWEYRADDRSDAFWHVTLRIACTAGEAPEGDEPTAGTLSGYWVAHRKGYDENRWEDMMTGVRQRYCIHTPGGFGSILRDVSPFMERAEALAKTPLEIAHTKAANAVMRRILDTGNTYNPNGDRIGMWNFFNYCVVRKEGNDLKMADNRRYSFEWKRGERTNGMWMLLNNDILDILQDNTGGVLWSDDWAFDTPMTVHSPKPWAPEAKGTLTLTHTEPVTTPAGCFTDCVTLETNSEGFRAGLDYRGGQRRYTFARHIGLVRVETWYTSPEQEGVTIRICYDLTAYEGMGEGYMPVFTGMFRRYECVEMNFDNPKDYQGWAEYTVEADSTGRLILLANRAGTAMRDKGEAKPE